MHLPHSPSIFLLSSSPNPLHPIHLPHYPSPPLSLLLLTLPLLVPPSLFTPTPSPYPTTSLSISSLLSLSISPLSLPPPPLHPIISLPFLTLLLLTTPSSPLSLPPPNYLTMHLLLSLSPSLPHLLLLLPLYHPHPLHPIHLPHYLSLLFSLSYSFLTLPLLLVLPLSLPPTPFPLPSTSLSISSHYPSLSPPPLPPSIHLPHYPFTHQSIYPHSSLSSSAPPPHDDEGSERHVPKERSSRGQEGTCTTPCTTFRGCMGQALGLRSPFGRLVRGEDDGSKGEHERGGAKGDLRPWLHTRVGGGHSLPQAPVRGNQLSPSPFFRDGDHCLAPAGCLRQGRTRRRHDIRRCDPDACLVIPPPPSLSFTSGGLGEDTTAPAPATPAPPPHVLISNSKPSLMFLSEPFVLRPAVDGQTDSDRSHADPRRPRATCLERAGGEADR
ncbi:hypothetical protein C7M84_015322 [Penaeus vannamei]|uniref:Uncharacterized protein n=1 Tax=Penaeus vannamei TaxID=6689 RepID=A0A3R7M417_PENVA|nr:hypothetical protein C7M84_015322 [Penaeus vannamei]